MSPRKGEETYVSLRRTKEYFFQNRLRKRRLCFKIRLKHCEYSPVSKFIHDEQSISVIHMRINQYFIRRKRNPTDSYRKIPTNFKC